jgi:DNA-binding GntR family transcriptional regulator
MDKLDLYIPRKAATLRATVEDRLRTAITLGHFRPGQRLVERELCDLLGVGRTSIREALRQLEAEGLITNVPHRGPSVTRVMPEEAKQLFEARQLLERFVVRSFAENRDPGDLRSFSDAIGKLREASRSEDRTVLIEAKVDVSNAMMAGCANVFVRQMLTSLNNLIKLVRVTSLLDPDRKKEEIGDVEGIQAIYNRIAAGDPDGAEAACIEHIRIAAAAAEKALLKGEINEQRDGATFRFSGKRASDS